MKTYKIKKISISEWEEIIQQTTRYGLEKIIGRIIEKNKLAKEVGIHDVKVTRTAITVFATITSPRYYYD